MGDLVNNYFLDSVQNALEGEGVIKALKTQLRGHIYKLLTSSKLPPDQSFGSVANEEANRLQIISSTRDLLEILGLSHTIRVFDAEVAGEDIAEFSPRTSHAASSSTPPRSPLTSAPFTSSPSSKQAESSAKKLAGISPSSPVEEEGGVATYSPTNSSSNSSTPTYRSQSTTGSSSPSKSPLNSNSQGLESKKEFNDLLNDIIGGSDDSDSASDTVGDNINDSSPKSPVSALLSTSKNQSPSSGSKSSKYVENDYKNTSNNDSRYSYSGDADEIDEEVEEEEVEDEDNGSAPPYESSNEDDRNSPKSLDESKQSLNQSLDVTHDSYGDNNISSFRDENDNEQDDAALETLHKNEGNRQQEKQEKGEEEDAYVDIVEEEEVSGSFNDSDYDKITYNAKIVTAVVTKSQSPNQAKTQVKSSSPQANKNRRDKNLFDISAESALFEESASFALTEEEEEEEEESVASLRSNSSNLSSPIAAIAPKLISPKHEPEQKQSVTTSSPSSNSNSRETEDSSNIKSSSNVTSNVNLLGTGVAHVIKSVMVTSKSEDAAPVSKLQEMRNNRANVYKLNNTNVMTKATQGWDSVDDSEYAAFTEEGAESANSSTIHKRSESNDSTVGLIDITTSPSSDQKRPSSNPSKKNRSPVSSPTADDYSSHSSYSEDDVDPDGSYDSVISGSSNEKDDDDDDVGTPKKSLSAVTSNSKSNLAAKSAPAAKPPSLFTARNNDVSKESNEDEDNEDDYGDDFEEVEEEDDASSASDDESFEKPNEQAITQVTKAAVSTISSFSASSNGIGNPKRGSVSPPRNSRKEDEDKGDSYSSDELESMEEEEEEISNVSDDVNQLEISVANNSGDEDGYSSSPQNKKNSKSTNDSGKNKKQTEVPASRSSKINSNSNNSSKNNSLRLSNSGDFSTSETEFSQTFDHNDFDFTTNALPNTNSKNNRKSGGW